MTNLVYTIKNRKEVFMYLKDALRIAIFNIIKENLTDVEVFYPPFEIQYLKNKENREYISKIVTDRIENALRVLKETGKAFEALKELKVSPSRNLLIPKKNLFDFRKCCYAEPLDEIIFLTLVLMISTNIERKRIATQNNIVYSYRLKKALSNSTTPTYLFDSSYNYTKFRSDITKKTSDLNAKVVVACDISNFYDRLNLHRLENTLLALPGINKNIVILINELLLFWSNRDSYGLPVGSNASRILAEASLISIDKYLLDKKIVFSRFVDDFRFFAKDARQAHSWLSMLVERLNQEGLFLNTSKTKIKSAVDIKRDDFMPEQKQDSTDTELEKSVLPPIIRGYSGVIPTKFRKISAREECKLKTLDIAEFKKEKIDIDLIEPENLQKYIRLLVAQQKWNFLIDAVNILNRFPQFIPYYLDCISKYLDEKKLPPKFRNTIFETGKDSSLLEYLRIYIFRFLSNSDSYTKEILNVYLNLKRSEGVYLGRSILESIGSSLSRDDLLEIKNGFIRADKSEKRIILLLLRKKLTKDEFNIFLKNISLTEDEPWFDLIRKDEETSPY